uniref:Secreted protein n=1 Tax=Cacopsylla melanoneura TaxID=428564 RepID=A0A8D8RGA2_9HEMI
MGVFFDFFLFNFFAFTRANGVGVYRQPCSISSRACKLIFWKLTPIFINEILGLKTRVQYWPINFIKERITSRFFNTEVRYLFKKRSIFGNKKVIETILCLRQFLSVAYFRNRVKSEN